jgi:hypothetical protein
MMTNAELNYDIYDKELLTIFKAFRQWRAYLEGAKYEVQVFSDHNNLQYFAMMKQLSCHQAQWAEYLSGFNYTIHYHAGCLGAKPNMLTHHPNVYPTKAAQPTINAINHHIAIPPEHLLAVVLLNKEALLAWIRQALSNNYYCCSLCEASTPTPP